MKKIVKDKELYDIMSLSIHTLCDTVKSTLGPIGNNVIIDHSDFSPFITNDGVTIAKNIESDNPVENTILTLAKEASIKTDELIGDGTTTTLVLLESIVDSGLELIKNGVKPIVLKRELENALKKFISQIDKQSRPCRKEDLINIALNSSIDDEISKCVFEVIKKVKNKESVILTDNIQEETEIIFHKGYQFETICASSYFLQNSKIVFNEPYILIIDGLVENIDSLATAINESLNASVPLIIIASDYDELIINYIVSLYLDKSANILLLKNPEYGKNQKVLLNILSAISNAKIFNPLENNSLEHLGQVSHIEIDSNKTTISFEKSKSITECIENIKETNIDDSFKMRQIGMLTTGLAEIKIGGISKTEIREKHMRYMDAISATSIASRGVVIGSGVSLLQVQEFIKPQNTGEEIIWKSLNKPFVQILKNAGLDSKEIYEKMRNSNFSIIYNVLENRFENVSDTKVIDPTEVVKESLKNAVSIAGMLLTTNHLVINELSTSVKNSIEEF